MNDPTMAETLAFWQSYMKGAPTLLLPTDFPRPQVKSGARGRLPLRIPDGITRTLASLCRSEQGTILDGLLAGFGAVLGRYSSDGVVVVGVPFVMQGANFGEVGKSSLSPLPVRLDIAGASSFRRLVRRTSDTIRSLSAHTRLPLERLIAELPTECDPRFHPLFQVVFDLSQAGPEQDPEPRHGAACVDMWLHLRAQSRGLSGWLEFDEDLFQVATAERFSEHLVNLLAYAVVFPDQPVTSLPFQSSEQIRRQVVDWNRTSRILDGAGCLVHDAVAERALLTPEAIAVAGRDGNLNYRDLDHLSRVLAYRLAEQGVGPEAPVGVFSRRSALLVVALLGILRAGGVYVPLDPAYPPERLAFMIDDAGVDTILVQPGTSMFASSRARTIELSAEIFEGDYTEIPTRSVSPENLAYIIYTSGTTGRPKGVMVSHAAMMNTLGWLQDTFLLSSDDVVAHKTSISFTDSIWELLWAPFAGARLAVIEEKVSQFPRLLLSQLRQFGVTVTQFVPAQMRNFLDEVERAGSPCPLPKLRWVFNGGEALPPALARDWYRSFPQTRIANAYGMTESAIYGTNWIVEPDDGEPTVLVGRPIANERAYVLDGAGQPCPPLCLGEIHLAGASLARGYFGRPDLTAEYFVPDPFGPPGGRMYRTGDLGRHLAAGEIACLGRLDRQVKVHGGRVELGEVEAALGKHPDVLQAVVVAKRLESDNQLIGYYTYRGGDPGARELYQFLADRLPSFMIPAFLVPMESFPLGPNGKVQHQCLVAPDQ